MQYVTDFGWRRLQILVSESDGKAVTVDIMDFSAEVERLFPREE